MLTLVAFILLAMSVATMEVVEEEGEIAVGEGIGLAPCQTSIVHYLDNQMMSSRQKDGLLAESRWAVAPRD
jgi:hypothetical protein